MAAAVIALVATACGDGTKTFTTDVQNRCVEPQEDDPTDYNGDEGRAVGARQAELRGDAVRLRQYGGEHPDDFTSVAFDNYPTVKVVGYFTDNVDEHQAAAAKLVRHPEVLEIRQSVQSDRDAQQIMEAMGADERARTHAQSYGPRSNGVVFATLGTTAEAQEFARELLDRYRTGICIDLAGHPFPKGSAPDKSTCPDTPLATDRVTGVEFGLTVASPVTRGEAGSGTARVTNNSATRVTAETGTNTRATLLLPGTNEVVARFTGFSDLGGRTLAVEPGETLEFPITFVTDDCRADADYSLPPGEYGVSLYMEAFGRSADATVTVVE